MYVIVILKIKSKGHMCIKTETEQRGEKKGSPDRINSINKNIGIGCSKVADSCFCGMFEKSKTHFNICAISLPIRP